MLYIKDIFKACVCSFCENIYEYNSIDEKDFIRSFKLFCMEDDLQSCLFMILKILIMFVIIYKFRNIRILKL